MTQLYETTQTFIPNYILLLLPYVYLLADRSHAGRIFPGYAIAQIEKFESFIRRQMAEKDA